MKVALVTGAAGAVGAAAAKMLAADGFHVVLADRAAERTEAIRAEIEREHGMQAVVEPPKPVVVSAWRQHCAQLLAQPSAFSNVLQLTACANQALQACGMQRVLILLADRNHTRLMTQQHSGLDKSASSLSLDPQQSQLLRRLLSAPAQLRLGPSNIAQFSATLPGTLKSLFPSEHLLIRSLANNNRVVMLILADQAGSAFSDASVQGFGKTVQCIERALSTFASRGR